MSGFRPLAHYLGRLNQQSQSHPDPWSPPRVLVAILIIIVALVWLPEWLWSRFPP